MKSIRSIKRRLWTLTSGFLILALLVPAFALTAAPAVLAAPAITQVYPAPASGQIGSGAPNVIAATATSAGSTISSMSFQTMFPEPFIAQEIFLQVPLIIFPPRGPATNDTTPLPLPAGMTAASLPPGSLLSFVIEGLVTAKSLGGQWTILVGAQTFRVSESLNTIIRNNGLGGPLTPPGVGDTVRVVGMRSLAAGPLVADVIAQRPAGAELADLTTFLFNGTVQTTGPTSWTIMGTPLFPAVGAPVNFTVNDPVFPAVIDPGLGVGAPVTVQYSVAPPAGGAITKVAAEIFLQVPLFIQPPRTTGPVTPDTTPVPAGLPAGSVLSFVIEGVVTAKDAVNGVWTISASGQSFAVYESLGTIIRNNGLGGPATPPGVGDSVRIVGMRALDPGPLVADVIAQRAPGVDLVDLAFFLFNGTVTAVGAATWTVTGTDPVSGLPLPVVFKVNDPTFPAVIDPGLGLGFPVTVQYLLTGLPPAPLAAAWAPMTFNAPSGQWRAVYNAPASPLNKPGILFLRAVDAAGLSTTVTSTITLLAVPAAPPVAPAGLTATVISPVQVDLAWTAAATNEASFRLERAASDAFTAPVTTFILPMNATSFNDTTVIGGSTYFYRLFAVNGAGPSGPAPVPPAVVSASPPIVIAASLPVPAAPANGAIVANLTPAISWTASTGTAPITYELQISANADTIFRSPVINATGLATNAFTVPAGTLASGTIYRWRVRASNAIGPSTYSLARIFRTPLGPTAPRPLAAGIVTTLTPTLSWVATPGAVSYDVQVSTAATFAPASIVATGTVAAPVTQFTVAPPLVGSRIYFWHVRVTTALGTSRWSVSSVLRTPFGPRVAPTPLAITPNGVTPALNWTVTALAATATSFDIQISTSALFTTTVFSQTGVTGTSLVVPPATLNPRTRYFWRIRGVNTFGASPWRLGMLFMTP